MGSEQPVLLVSAHIATKDNGTKVSNLDILANDNLDALKVSDVVRILGQAESHEAAPLLLSPHSAPQLGDPAPSFLR